MLSLFLLGSAEERLGLKMRVHGYEVTGANADTITTEVNRVLEGVHSMMQNPQFANTQRHLRLQFEAEATRREQKQVWHDLERSTVFESATELGPVMEE